MMMKGKRERERRSERKSCASEKEMTSY